MLKYQEFILNESTQETFNDYPKSATNNAKKALEWRDKYGRDVVKGGTEVGWQRANQLAKREAISKDVVKRMAQFNRHRKNSEVNPKYKSEPWKDRGYIAWLIWGGDEGIDWAIRKTEQWKRKDGKLNESFSMNFDWDKIIQSSKISLDELQSINKSIFLKKLEDIGIKDSTSQANALAQIKHESDYVPKEEDPNNYKPKWLFKYFGKGNRFGNTERFKSLEDAEKVVNKGAESLFNRLYSDNKYLGNKEPDDGYKYRGRGFIQLTGRDNYEKIGNALGIDLINKPELALHPEHAFDISIEYLNIKLRGLSKLKNIDTVCDSIGYANGAPETQRRKQSAKIIEKQIKEQKIKPIDKPDMAIRNLVNLNLDGLKMFKPGNESTKDNTNVNIKY